MDRARGSCRRWSGMDRALERGMDRALARQLWARAGAWIGRGAALGAGRRSLRRPVYGLRQAPREWHDTLRTTLAALGFAPGTADPSLFLHTDTSLPPFYFLVYLDDIVFATADTEALTLVKANTADIFTKALLPVNHQRFSTVLGLLALLFLTGLVTTCSPPLCLWGPVYGLRQAPREWHDTLRTTPAALGFAPSTADPSLFLRIDTSLPPFYVHVYVLQHFGFQFSSPQPTPLSTSHSLSAPPSNESTEPSGPYPELVGCLMYLMTCTRPDLAYPLSLVARYVAPGRHRKVHWDAAKRVLRYLCNTLGMGLVLGGRGPVVLTDHADASWRRGQLCLAYVATTANTADIFTKALPPVNHQRFSTVFGLLALLFLTGLWHDTLSTTLAALGFIPSTADPSLFLRIDTSLPPFYVLVYINDLVFATANTEALTLVKSELQKRHICADLGPSTLWLPVLLATAHSSVYQPLALSSTFGRVRRAKWSIPRACGLPHEPDDVHTT
ncbi:unnamed protein product [Closterium sp. NIES-53]